MSKNTYLCKYINIYVFFIKFSLTKKYVIVPKHKLFPKINFYLNYSLPFWAQIRKNIHPWIRYLDSYKKIIKVTGIYDIC